MEIIELPGSDQIRGEGTEIFLTGKKGKKDKEGKRNKEVYHQILDLLLHNQLTSLVRRGGFSGGILP